VAESTYAIEGPIQRIIIRQLELKSENARMTGEGHLDFATRKVEMVFHTEESGWSSVPILGPILKSANRGLFEIRVSGTIHEPQIKSGALNTITTTIDRAINPQPPSEGKKKAK
jgi:hypothetical protein